MAFKVRVVKIPLFGVVESKPLAQLHQQFRVASPSDELTIPLDDAQLALISDQLELEADGVAYEMRRYVGGEFREKSKGPGGNRLGDFGEALAYLAQRKSLGLVRVVDYRLDAGPPRKGARYPIPDFLGHKQAQIGCVEVKTKEALKYLVLGGKSRAKLAPCERLGAIRADALPQLGFDKHGARTTPTHKLLLQGPSKRMVPFPADFGVAIGVLVRDGRLDLLRAQKKYWTPLDCRPTTNCWECLKSSGEDADAVLVRMDNAPGRLLLPGSQDRGVDWLHAYRRWSEAVWARELVSVRETTSRLVDVTAAWIDALFHSLVDAFTTPRQLAAARSRLVGFWPDYLTDTLTPRGLRDAVEPRKVLLDRFRWGARDLHDPAPPMRLVPPYDSGTDATGAPVDSAVPDVASAESALPRREPIAKLMSLDVLMRRVLGEEAEAHRDCLSVPSANGQLDRATVTRSPGSLDLRVCSSEWSQEQKLDDAAAMALAQRTLSLAASLLHLALPTRETQLRRFDNELSEDSDVIGWSLEPNWFDPWLASGDSLRRSRLIAGLAFLHIFPDGRAHFQVVARREL